MAVARPPTPIGDGECPQAIDTEGVAGEVTVAGCVEFAGEMAALEGMKFPFNGAEVKK